MIYLGYFILIFTLIQLLVALMNLITETHLPRTGVTTGRMVSLLIPARNEEKNIGNILEDIKDQAYENMEVIIFNDQSEDRTVEIVTAFIQSDNRFRLINSDTLPEGWLGKNYACHSLSGHASGSYYMFLDADVRIAKNLIGDSVSYSEKHGTGLISIFPEQIIRSFGEQITVPNMNYILVSLLPLILVRKSGFASLSAANGQFMCFKASAYNEITPHERMKSDKVEDIAIARLFKNEGIKIACLLGDDRIRCRMYYGFIDAVNGFSKNVTAFFGKSFTLAVLFWLITTFGFIVVYLAFPLKYFIAYLTAYLMTRIIISVPGGQNVINSLVYILPLQLSMGLFICKASYNKIFRKFEWKGRNIS
jgi:glycosyltransferase involved in cell wall biosynthesis